MRKRIYFIHDFVFSIKPDQFPVAKRIEHGDEEALVAFHRRAAVGIGVRLQPQHEVNARPGLEQPVGRIDSVWAVMARQPRDLGSLANDPRWIPLEPTPGLAVWTDDLSNLFAVLRAPAR